MATQDNYIRTALRVPPELHTQLHKAAFVAKRTFNAEILSRLQSSFEERPASTLPPAVDQAVQQEQKERGGTRDEALTRLVLAAQAQGGTVVNLRVGPGTSIPKLHAILEVTMKSLAPDTKSVVTLDTTQPD